jgi:hypothetical protein
MGYDYVGFGLHLRAGFRLPGACPAGAGDRSDAPLAVDLVSASELDRLWSGAASASHWRGRLRDGAELTITRGRGKDLLFAYGGRARFLLDPGAAGLSIAVEEESDPGWQRVLLSRVLPLVAIARGYEALHAAAVETPVGVVAIAGASGAGKSTLAAELLRRGHRLFGDDVLAIGSDGDRVLAYPGGAHLSLDPGREGDLDVEVLGELGGKLWAVAAVSATAPAPVAAVALLERGGGEVRAQEIPASPLALAPFMLGLPDDDARDAARFGVYADLVEGCKLLRLSGSAEAPAPDFAAALERAVEAPAMVAAGAGR